ncbi:hypothetical protein M0R19_02820 [Candidatus Pacearchaeota archaeon]|jgi:hypothetical protein|nr:hypothetical protein [Candidatus Pacearchaeota archaeon]
MNGIPLSELEKIINDYGNFIKYYTKVTNNLELTNNYHKLKQLGITLRDNKYVQENLPFISHTIDCCLTKAKEKYYS